jgi:hypothetical protein
MTDAMGGSQWCWNHDPSTKEQRRRKTSKAGKAGGRSRRSWETTHIKEKLTSLSEDVLSGKVDRSDAAVAGQLLNIVLRAISIELETKHQQEILERLEALEAEEERRHPHRKVF